MSAFLSLNAEMIALKSCCSGWNRPGSKMSKSHFLQLRRQADVGIAPGIAVAVVCEEKSDLLVGVDLIPDRGEHHEDVFDAPVVVVGPLEALRRIAAAAEEPGLPGRRCGDAGHAVELALVADRVRVFRRRVDQHEINVVLKDQFARDFRRAVRVRLAVLDEDFDREAAGRVGNAPFEGFAGVAEDEIVDLADCRERAGRGRHKT